MTLTCSGLSVEYAHTRYFVWQLYRNQTMVAELETQTAAYATAASATFTGLSSGVTDYAAICGIYEDAAYTTRLAKLELSGVETDAETVNCYVHLYYDGTDQGMVETRYLAEGSRYYPADDEPAYDSATYELHRIMYYDGASHEVTPVDGSFTVPSVDFTLDYYYVTGSSPPPSGDGRVWIFNGTQWVEATPYIFNGSQWVQATPYIFNGTQWA